MDGAERTAYYKKLKKEKRKAQNKANYQKKEKKATVNAHTMRCVAPELTRKSFRGKSQCILTQVQHMDILSALY